MRERKSILYKSMYSINRCNKRSAISVTVACGIASLLTISIVTPLFAQTKPTKESITINECYERALSLSETDKIREQDLRIAEARYRESLGNVFPEIRLFAEQTNQDKIRRNRTQEFTEDYARRTIPNGSYLIPDRTTSTSPNQVQRTGVNIRWPIFSGFRTKNEMEAAKYDGKQIILARERDRELLYRDVADLYYQTLQYEETLHILEDEKKALQARIAELQNLVALGRSRTGELLSAKSDLSANLVEQENAKSLLNASKELLAFLIGTPSAEIELEKIRVLPSKEELESFLKTSEERKDILAGIESLRAEKERLKAEQSGHWPNMSVEGNYYFSQNPATGRDWNVLFRIELPIFQGGSVESQVDRARATVRSTELSLDRLKRSADYEVRAAYNDFVTALAKTLLLKEALELADATYQIQRRDYRLGIVTNLEVLTSLARLHQTRRSLAETRISVWLAHLRLEIASGRQIHETE